MGKSRERIPLSATATAALSSAMPVFAPDKIVKGKKARSSAPKRPAGAMTLKCLLDAGIIQPGARILTLEYKGAVTRADLNSEGQIKFNGVTFESPSAFSIYVKRLSNPTRKADDGWKAVKYEGK